MSDKYLIKAKKYEKKIEKLLKNKKKIVKDWVEISKDVRNSIVQIYASTHIFDPLKPYYFPPNKLARGSGFIIYSSKDKILIITNSHVVENSNIINIRTEQTGEINLKANIINLCKEKDIALLEIDNNDIKYLKKLPNKLEFDDSRLFNDTIEVLTAGYPLGESNIKFTKGVLSGNQQTYSIEYMRNISYLQIDAPINAGNSGGPLFNKYGKIIGINSAAMDDEGVKNVCYAIPSYIIYSIIIDLLNVKNDNKILQIPNVNIKWNNCNEDIFNEKKIKSYNKGVYIYDTIINSSFNLKKDDILYKMVLKDISSNKNIFNIDYLLNKNINDINSCNLLEINIDNMGLVNIYIIKNKNIKVPHEWTKNRKIKLDEFLDSIQTNIKVKLHIYRDNKNIIINNIINNNNYLGIKKISSIYEKNNWEVCLGCCFTPLTYNIIENIIENRENNNIQITKYLSESNRKNKYICISNVFINSNIYNINIINLYDIGIIKYINNHKIETMSDLRNILIKYKNQTFIIEFVNGKIIYLSDINGKLHKNDEIIIKQNKVPLTDFCKNNWIN